MLPHFTSTDPEKIPGTPSPSEAKAMMLKQHCRGRLANCIGDTCALVQARLFPGQVARVHEHSAIRQIP